MRAERLLVRIAPLLAVEDRRILGARGFLEGNARLSADTALSAEEAGYYEPSGQWSPDLERSAVVGRQLFEECLELAVKRLYPAHAFAELQEAASVQDWLTTVQAAERLGVDRSTLDAMAAKAPKDLPGAPARVGEGKQRRHLRWSAVRLEEWLAAYRTWESSRGRPPKRR